MTTGLSHIIYNHKGEVRLPGWKTLTAVIASLCLTGLTACHHIPLYEPATGVYLAFEIHAGAKTDLAGYSTFPDPNFWQKIVNGTPPSQFRLCMYDRETNTIVYDDYFGTDGGFIEAPTGYYDMVIYSVGADAVRINGAETKGNVRAVTSPTGAAVKMTRVTKTDENGEETEQTVNLQYPIHNMPDHVYVGTAENVYIPVRSNVSKAISIDVEVESLLDTYTFEATDIEGIDRITSMTCYITGQVTEKYLWDGRYKNELCAIPVPVIMDKENSAVRGVFNTLGKHPYALANVFMNIMIQNAQGEMYQWIFDVTDQFHNPDNIHNEIVVTQHLVVPDAEQGGFHPDVSDWEAEVIHVPL